MSDEPWEQHFAAHAPLVMASTQVLGESRLPVAYAFRLEPNNPYDSGWNFWSGYETQTFLSDPESFAICPLAAFLELDPSLQALVDRAVGTAWERDSSGLWRESRPPAR